MGSYVCHSVPTSEGSGVGICWPCRRYWSAAMQRQPVRAEPQRFCQRKVDVRIAAFVVGSPIVQRNGEPGIGLERGRQMEPRPRAGRRERNSIAKVADVPHAAPVDEAVQLIAFEESDIERVI